MNNKQTNFAPIIIIAYDASELSEGKPAWSAPVGRDGYIEIRDVYWSATFGACQKELLQIDRTTGLLVDFSKICWIDPLPLLAIFIAIRTCCERTKSSLTLLLGNEPTAKTIKIRGGFLKFLSQHGFLNTLKGLQPKIKLGTVSYSLEMEALLEKLSSNMYAMAYPDSLCLDAMIQPVADFQCEEAVESITSKWSENLKASWIRGFFEGEPELLGELIDKINILLVELMLNAGEHAYDCENDDLSTCYIGLYARIRDRDGNAARLWLKENKFISNERDCCPTFKGFDFGNSHSGWLEVFYVDQGRGLLADLELWKEKATGTLNQKLTRIKPTTNKLHEVSKLLFQEPISRHNRADRTVLTGLQYVRYALAEGGDCAGVYTSGEWVGARLPWRSDLLGNPINVGKQHSQSTIAHYPNCSIGTAWQFCFDLEDVLFGKTGLEMSGWNKIIRQDVESGYNAETQYNDWQVFDDRNLGGSVKHGIWQNVNFAKLYSLWLPGIIRKNLVYQWFNAIFNHGTPEDDKPWVWIIADLSRKDARLLDTVLSSAKYRGKRHYLLVYMVTSDWYIKCLKSITITKSGDVFQEDKEQTRLAKKKRASFIFNILRKHDSTIFWEGLLGENEQPDCSAFINEEVIWERDANDTPCIVLNGYLDLTQALQQPERVAVARRALYRTWYLHTNKAECVAADPLLTNLLPREARLDLSEPKSRKTAQGKQQVVVGSVYVTGSTTRNAKKHGQSAIHLLQHAQIKELDVPRDISSRYALNWFEDSVEMADLPEGTLPYERIPGTPYISRGGAKAAPIRRFSFDEGEKTFSRHFYGKNPQDTYTELIRFGLLKLGHWVYGAHHDLLTINLGICAETKRFYKDTAIEWLLRELEGLAKGAQDEQAKIIVVYSSHSVTEKMISAVKDLARERNSKMPRFIPVHFLAPHSQTTIRIPSLTYNRIRSELENSFAPGRQKKVILLDDGAVTGKVQREMEQLLLNAGAEEVIHVGLVTRTGLPLYRKFLEGAHSNTHRYYWRWDVPPLGNARTCPLCRAIDRARELSRRMWNEDSKKELKEWVKGWEASSVTTHWRRHGLTPEHLPDVREITFGKEWIPGKNPIKYPLKHITTTGLAATTMEIIRTTSYKDVGIKLARNPWGDDYRGDKSKWRDAKLEILICQILIYFDDFTDQELQERFQFLLQVMLEPASSDSNSSHIRTHQLERLGCLTLFLATERQIKYITKELWKLLKHTDKLEDHLLVAIGILMRGAGNFSELTQEMSNAELNDEDEVRIKSLLSTAHFYGQGEEARGTRHAISSLILLLGVSDSCSHTGFLRKKLIGELDTDEHDLARDLKTICQSLMEIDLHVLLDTSASSLDPRRTSATIHQHIKQIENTKIDIDDIKSDIHSLIIGNDDSLSVKFREIFVIAAASLPKFIGGAIANPKWKIKVEKNISKNKGRWGDSPPYVLPDIDVAMDGIENPNEIFVIFPPISQKMVRDYLYNVVHSSRRISDSDFDYDMACNIKIKDDLLLITLWNYTDQHGPPRKKAAEGVVSGQLLHEPVSDNYSDGKMTVEIQLPLVEYYYRSEK